MIFYKMVIKSKISISRQGRHCKLLTLKQNAKKHGIEVHGYTEETWNEEIAKNKENFRKLIKTA
jgi:hypothetical protein